MPYFKRVAIIFSLCTASAYADSYLCISEITGRVGHTDTEILSAASGKSDFKVIVREDGLYEFGSDDAWLPKCDYLDSGGINCSSIEPYWGGTFSMNENNIFDLVGLGFIPANEQESQKVFLNVYAGKCSKI